MKATTAAKKVLADNAVTGQGLPTYGTQVLMNVINEMGALPTRNHRDVQFEDARKIFRPRRCAKSGATDGKANLVTNAACFGCTIACGRISKMDETHFSVVNKPEYWGATGGLEYEAAWALGAANGVGDLEALTYANMLCNEDGYRPDHLRRHRRRGDGTVRPGHSEEGADRHGRARSARHRRWSNWRR